MNDGLSCVGGEKDTKGFIGNLTNKNHSDQHVPKIKELIERLYNVNAWISGRYITKLYKPDLEGFEAVNKALSEIIIEFRELMRNK